MMAAFFAALSALSLAPASTQALVLTPEPPIAGQAIVLDGDTIIVDGSRIRLVGVDAPEMAQEIGPKSKDALVTIIGGRDVVCKPEGKGYYNRILAECFPVLASGRVSSVSVNRLMVSIGAASIYPGDRRYERYQTRAIERCVGIWEHAQLGYCWRARK